eukprot:scaffold9419_cov120-Isochrysis_galbana.AAC.3
MTLDAAQLAPDTAEVGQHSCPPRPRCATAAGWCTSHVTRLEAERSCALRRRRAQSVLHMRTAHTRAPA